MHNTIREFFSLFHVLIGSYVLIFLLSFGEGVAFVGFIVPGSIAVIAAGFLAAHGLLSIPGIYVAAVLGAALGDNLSFLLGKKKLITFRPRNKVFKTRYLRRGERFFSTYGAHGVFWARFVGWVRSFVPFVAGLLGLNENKFLFWNTLSVLIWAASHIALGYFFGATWQAVQLWATRLQ